MGRKLGLIDVVHKVGWILVDKVGWKLNDKVAWNLKNQFDKNDK